MTGLNERDLDVLDTHARQGHRERYWNYLAQRPGNDGYGLLALGVVRNDDPAGRIANAHAHRRAHGDGRRMSERDWQDFGVDLIARDLRLRCEQWQAGDRQHALNLPVRYVQQAHDRSFDQAGIHRDAWTPRPLLEAARADGAEGAAERVWTRLLNQRLRGLERGRDATADAYRHLGLIDGSVYVAGLATMHLTCVVVQARDVAATRLARACKPVALHRLCIAKSVPVLI
jgi:hypothetical protein